MALQQSDEGFVHMQFFLMKIAEETTVKKPKLGGEEETTPKMAGVVAATGGGGEEKKQSFERREKMREMETRIQAMWAGERTFEVDAGDNTPDKEKFFCTFPYPYMNGRLHLGHAFTVTKADFMAGYQRLKGKKVLIPFAFHCTGMPISAAATKLKRELENGPLQTKDEDEEEPPQPPAPTPAATQARLPDTKFVSKKSKTAKKTGAAKTQSEILIKSGIPP